MIKLKAAFAALAMTALSACNMVVSDKPWFDAASGPQLKDGLWANFDSPACKLETGTPLTKWPECAAPMMIRGNAYAGPAAGSDPASAAVRFDPSKWQALEHRLVEGDPLVDQIFIDLSQASSDDGIDRSKAKSFYLYLAVKPVATDSAGLITETLRWPVMCGPIPINRKGQDGKTVFETDQPFAGLTLEGGRCTAADTAALRGAAARSEGLAKAAGFAIVSSRWISDGVQ
jgi:hypothetical protein